MTICHSILTPIVVLIRTLLQTVREVVRTVCDWVSSTIRTVKTVVERVCSWLPWPINELCNLVTRVIEVIETVWNWVCHEVIDRVIEWVERFVEYVAYIVRWVCWVVSWVVRGPALLLCLLGVKPPRFLHVCVTVLTEDDGTPAVTWGKVDRDLRQAQAILRNCNLQLVVTDRRRITKPEFLGGTTCEFTGMFRDFFTWFAARECGGCAAVTVYYVRSIPGAIGCAYPGSNWVTVAAGGDGRTMVQEIGHLADLWSHSSDPNNVMGTPAGSQITSFQCCMFRTSRFSSPAPCPKLPEIGRRSGALSPLEPELPEPLEPLPEAEVSHGFQRIRSGDAHAIDGTGAAAAGLALTALAWMAIRATRR